MLPLKNLNNEEFSRDKLFEPHSQASLQNKLLLREQHRHSEKMEIRSKPLLLFSSFFLIEKNVKKDYKKGFPHS